MDDDAIDSFLKQCELLKWAGEQVGFREQSTYDEHIDGVRRIGKSITTIGLLRSDDCTSAAWHVDLPDSALPSSITIANNAARIADSLYYGDKFLLTRAENQVTAFDLEKLERIKRLQYAICIHSDLPPCEMRIARESRVLVIDRGWVRIALSGLHGDNYDEEERTALSNRLANSQPFFEFKAPLSVDWSKLVEPVDDTFQNITELLLHKEDAITEIVSVGKSRAADRGRDLHVTEKLPGLFAGSATKWLVQCKYSKHSVSPDTLAGWTDRVREHGYHGFWLATNSDITPSLFDQFKDVSQNTDIKTRIWQRSDFHRKLNVYSELLRSSPYFEQS